ncbi:MAG: response regulator [Deltaproteobacteria bacterium]|nr:response regulator [Deltaproteobacteria bacterium]MBN2674423.1 response regulator [Deltaproteobacteria bacterium]
MDYEGVVLIVEDDETIRTSASMFLEDADFEVYSANDGFAATEMLKRITPDVIVTDIRMPKLDGFGLIETVAKQYPEIPIIVMSGTGDLNDVVKALRFGVWDFILKPIADMNILKHSINKSLEKARLIEENKLQRKKLEIANRELESFNYSVSHDLRSPLHAIDAFSEMLQEDCEHLLPDENKDHLRRIRSAADRMNKMIDDLLSLSRLSRQPLDKSDVNLSYIASTIIDDLRAGQSPGMKETATQVTIEENIQVQADIGLAKNVLENILGNAWKYTRKTTSPSIEMGTCDTEFGKAVYVRDNGAGFSMKSYDKLFGVFQRLHHEKEFQGTGVGLATVKRIIQKHGGEIWADAEIDKGAAFYFTFPDIKEE